MFRRQATQATAAQIVAVPDSAHARRSRRQMKRLGKRVVQKSDGRYLIYYDKA